MADPTLILAQGLKVNPVFTKFAFGIPVLLAAVAVGSSFFQDPISAVIAGVVGFIALLLVMAVSYAVVRSDAIGPAGVALAWFVSFLFMAVCVVIFVSWAFDRPKALPCLVRPLEPCPNVIANLATRDRPDVSGIDRSKYAISFQFAGFKREIAEDISRSLRSDGWEIPAEKRTPKAAGINEVRYVGAKDKAAAEALANDISRSARVTTRITTKQNRDVKSGSLEVWVSLN
jgi:hypothetical protein